MSTSDLPSFPGSPASPFSPGAPGGPCDPLNPGGPGGPTHTETHAYTIKYCNDFENCLQTKLGVLYQCTNIVGRQK